LEGASLLCTSSLAFSARLAAEKLEIPWVGVVLQPLMFLSSFDPPRLAEAPGLGPLLSHLGPRASRAVFRLMKRFIDKQCAPVHGLRREIGLPPNPVDPLIDGQFSRNGTIALYSKLLGDVRPDYPPRTCVAGFTFYDGAESSKPALEPALQRFLDSGPPPLVFTLGSFAVASSEDFYAVGLAAARAVKRRAVLLVGDHHPPSLPADPGSDAIVCGYAPYSAIFPRAEIVIHQGGIGTTAQALRAGRPQLVMPVFADQPDNAARVVRLGVGRTIRRKQFRERRVIEALRELLDKPVYRHRAAEVSSQVAHEDGAARAAKFLLSESG
jgi:UDP:flavonoid glycosyltransferase YjiC (YdhE family)